MQSVVYVEEMRHERTSCDQRNMRGGGQRENGGAARFQTGSERECAPTPPDALWRQRADPANHAFPSNSAVSFSHHPTNGCTALHSTLPYILF